MSSLIVLSLSPDEANLNYVKNLPGLKELNIDDNYGLVLISPKRGLYAIRVNGEIDLEKLRAIQPKVKGVYPDTPIAPFQT